MEPISTVITIITTIATLVDFAKKYGPVAYAQLIDLFGDSIPTYEKLAADNADLQTKIDAEKEASPV